MVAEISTQNTGVKYLLCVIDAFTKYAQVKPLTDKKAKTVLQVFIGIVNESKLNQINYLLITVENFTLTLGKWLDDDVLMYSTHNKGRSVVAETFIRTLKDKIRRKKTIYHRKSYLDYLNKLVDKI